MPPSTDTDLDEPRLKLLKTKLGDLFDWQPPTIVETVGPFGPGIFDEFDRNRRGLVADCRARIREFSESEILVLSSRDFDDPLDVRSEWSGFLARETDQLTRFKPPWYAGGFGHPDFVADFEYWCKMPRFSIEEVLCLSIGVEPEHFSATRVSEISKMDRDKIWPALRFLISRYEQLDRNFHRSEDARPVFPGRLLAWIEKVEFQAHPEFIRLLKRYHADGNKSDQASTPASGRSDEREIDSIAKLLTAIAINEYGYRPDQVRSPVPKEIAEIAASLGLSISDDTVRKYLKRGARFLPEDWNPDQDLIG